MCDKQTVTCKERPDPCPVMPELSGREGCYCEVNHTLCVEDEMCDNRTAIAGCTPRPPPCPPMPGVTYGVTRCYCRFSGTICEAVHMCNERNNSCSIPAMCPDPTTFQNWADLNLEISSSYNQTTLIEGSNITIMCTHNTFLTRKVLRLFMKANDCKITTSLSRITSLKNSLRIMATLRSACQLGIGMI